MQEPEKPADRFDAVETNWSLIREACRDTTVHAAPARAALVVRYLPAISRYVAAIVKDEAASQDLTQDVCARLMNGDFSGADQERGRFRDYLKTAVRNIARNHWRQEKRRSASPLPESLAEDSPNEDAWVVAWRGNVLDMTWRAMDAWERKTPGAIGSQLLRLRASMPNDSMEKIAAGLEQVAGELLKPNAIRTQLHRARSRFAQFLLAEVTRTLKEPTEQQLQEELAALGLLEYLPKQSNAVD
ncbi:MAG: RNA polymerase sigma factor [Planctomycetaceae bacterium]